MMGDDGEGGGGIGLYDPLGKQYRCQQLSPWALVMMLRLC